MYLINVTLFGIVIDDKDTQFPKASRPIDFKLVYKLIGFLFWQL